MLFSVIVPIYKVEKYIKRCIDSVLMQSYTDFELILVDDGSPDQCPAICDKYAESDSRIKVIHKENGGLVSARQAGIRIAAGEYIFNLDGDDAIDQDTLEHARKIICDTKTDMISFAFRCYINGQPGETREDSVLEGLYNKEQIEESIYPKLLSDKNMEHVLYYVTGKAFKRELILKHQLNVNPSISLGEDVCCVFPCYLEAQTVYISKKALYYYTVRNDSISSTVKAEQITRIENVILELRSMRINKPEDFDKQISRYSCFMCFIILVEAAEGNHFRVVREIKKIILNSVHNEEIKKASFENITIKSRITVFLLKKQCIKLAFYFLYLCKEIKRMRKSVGK